MTREKVVSLLIAVVWLLFSLKFFEMSPVEGRGWLMNYRKKVVPLLIQGWGWEVEKGSAGCGNGLREISRG